MHGPLADTVITAPAGREARHALVARVAAAAIVVLLLVFAPATASAQAWRAEQTRIDGEIRRVLDKARDAGAENISGTAAELEALQVELLEKVVKPALRQASTCRQRMDAVEMAVSLEQQAQLIDSSLGDLDWKDLTTGTYGDNMLERCMNELYRACVAEDNPLYTLTMSAWVIGYERQKQLLGVEPDDPGSFNGELDPRITKCRGPWYQVRIAVERSGVDEDLGGPWHDSDIADGWLGRGLSWRPVSYSGTGFAGDFTRRKEQASYGARCPDGGCPGNCGFTAVAEGTAVVEYELEAEEQYRMLTVSFLDGEGEEKLERNTCGHADLPISFYPEVTYTATFPPDIVTRLTDEPLDRGGADPRVTDAMDEWPRMFQSRTVELEIWGEPIGRLEVQSICDGQELWGRGSAECQQLWLDYLDLHGHATPIAPWDRPRERER